MVRKAKLSKRKGERMVDVRGKLSDEWGGIGGGEKE